MNENEIIKESYNKTFTSCIQAIENGEVDKAKKILLSLNVSNLPEAARNLHTSILLKLELRNKKDPEKLNLQQLKPGVSIVTACMNRHHNLLKVVHTWLATEANEIIIVDWSSTEELWPKLKDFNDSRIKVIRVDGEKKWILTHAFNIALREASYDKVYKIDCDILLGSDFIRKNPIIKGGFIRGFWKVAVDMNQEDQRYVNGTFGAFKKDLIQIGFYDERIVTYGWDDSDLYQRLTMNLGLSAYLIDTNSVFHIEQQESQRTENQDVNEQKFLGRFGSTDMEAAKNRFYTQILGDWANYSYPHSYDIKFIHEQLRQGRRTTDFVNTQGDLKQLAEVFAVRQLTLWAGDLPSDLTLDSEVGFELSRLFRDSHAIGKSELLFSAIKRRRGIHFVRIPQGTLRNALIKTISVLNEKRGSVSREIFILEDEINNFSTKLDLINLPYVFFASRALVDALAKVCGASCHSGILILEELFLKDVGDSRLINLNREILQDEVLFKADYFVDSLKNRYERVSNPHPSTCLVTSIYDEDNLIRLVEYLCCIVLNLRIFEKIILAYESKNGLVQELLAQILEKLKVPMGRLLITPFNRRPSFEELFALQSGLSDGTILAVVNADIVFDNSLQKINQIDINSNLVTLSRWDVIDDCHAACLIRLENGTPNTFSSDAWIVKTPFEPDFYLDYQIGTMHCDSFINNQLSLSKRYGIVNPCLDIRIYHLHDDRFNSSAEKYVRDYTEIQIKFQAERIRNANQDPAKGVSWTSAAYADVVPPALRLQNWRPKALVLDFASGELGLGYLLLLHALRPILEWNTDTVLVIRMREADLHGSVGRILQKYQKYFNVNNMIFDIDEQEFDILEANGRNVITRTTSFVELAQWLQDVSPGAWQAQLAELIVFPSNDVNNIILLRIQIVGELTSKLTLQLECAIQATMPEIILSLSDFYATLPSQSFERIMLTPYISDITTTYKYVLNNSASPRVTFITSLFRGAEFLPGYLDNVLMAARHVRGEVIIVDANKDNTDGKIVRQYLDAHQGASSFIRYIHLDNDPGLYNCWRIAIEQARAPLISNANLDDKRSPHHTAALVDLLEMHPEYAAACGSIVCIKESAESDWYRLQDSELWFYGEGSREIGFEDLYVIDDQGDIRSRNVMHCMPVWRKNLHTKHGYFNEEKYGTSADWAFWLQCTNNGEKLYFKEQAFGKYYLNPESHNRRNDQNGEKELRIISNFFERSQSKIVKQQ